MRKGLNVMSVNYPEDWSDLEKLGAGQPRFYRIWSRCSSRWIKRQRKLRKKLRQRRLRYLAMLKRRELHTA
jgi:hypothetical protein